MDVYMKLSSQTAGKDKLARLIQYASKMVAHLLERLKYRVDLADQLKHLEFHFGTFRKLLRLGKSIEVLHGTLKTLHIPDLALRTLVTLGRIAQALFLLADHLIWLGRVGLVKIKDSERINRIYNQCWLYFITLGLLRDFYEIRLSLKRYPGAPVPPAISWAGSRSIPSSLSGLVPSYVQSLLIPYASRLTTYCQDHRHIAVDTLKNTCDLFIPLSNLGSIRISPGVVGILGVISSLAGMVSLIDPTAKMIPS